MEYKTYEIDQYGRLRIYPSLTPTRAKGFWRKISSRILKALRVS
jgi:hypothetical protein